MNNARPLYALILVLLLSPFAFSQKGSAVELPMKMRGSMPAVEVMVNGKGPFLFAIDTGGQGQARLDETLVKTLALEPVDEIRASDGSGANARVLPVYEAASIKVGGLEFKNVRAPSRNYNPRPDLPKIDGILGFNLFSDYLINLDYPGKKVRISKGALAKGPDVISFESPNGVPVVEIGVGKEKIKAHIDSGNMAGAFMLPAELVEKLEKESEPVTVGRARTVTSEIEIKRVKLKDAITFGPFKHESPTVTFPALGTANIGSLALAEYSLTFDQANRLIKLERSKPAKAAAPTGEYGGSYGDRTITEENGTLFLQRTGGPKLKLLPGEAKDEFRLEIVPTARIKFVRDAKGQVSEVHVLTQQGAWEKSIRDIK
ncbi:MAG: aspartyl protease family protein [Chloracidobacterium sp.]|nr:aspartyl protease family protein [Chloracidobacterium sp.]